MLYTFHDAEGFGFRRGAACAYYLRSFWTFRAAARDFRRRLRREAAK